MSTIPAPRLHTLYRYWTKASNGEPTDQEWDGWRDGRHWHALYGMGVWEAEFVVRWVEHPPLAVEIEEQA